ncbi:MAG: hypothetical protein V2A70_03475, partial [Candidatus Omnitrophota bacterium]
MRILNTGNVGVGTFAPNASLQVGSGVQSGTADLSTDSALIKGNLEVDGIIYGDGSQITGISGTVSDLTNYSVPRSQADGKTLIDSGIYMDVNGNVGIGTNLPVSTLSFMPGTTASNGINFGDDTANLYRSASGVIKSDGVIEASQYYVGNGKGLRAVGSIRLTATATGNISAYTNNLEGFSVTAGGISGTGTTDYFKLTNYRFNPSSGSAEHNIMKIDSSVIIYQTGSASGITRGIYIDPTLTSAVDFRAIEVARGKSVFNDNVGIGTSAPRGLLEVDATPYTSPFIVTTGLNVGIGTFTADTRLTVGPTPPTAVPGSSPVAALKGDLVVDGKIYGNGSQLTNIAGAVSGLTNYSVPRSQADGKTLIDSGIYMDVNGNVGIGSINPTSKLFIDAGSFIAGEEIMHLKFSAGDKVIIKRNGSNDGVDMYLGTSTGSGNSGGRLFVNSIAGKGYAGAPLTLSLGSASGYFLFTNSASNEILRINTNGNIGIGTNAPAARIHVVGVGSTTGKAFEIDDNLNNSKVTVLDNGNVGIGTTGPRANLEIVGTGSTTGTVFQIDDNLYNPKVTVLDNGNVGIGTLAPNYLAEVKGTLYSSILRVGNTDTFIIGRSSGSVELNAAGGQTTIGAYATDYQNRVNIFSGNISRVPLILNGFSGQIANLFEINSNGLNNRGDVFNIGATGNVGIGTTGPRGLLEVDATPYTSPFIVTTGLNVGIGTFTADTRLTVGPTPPTAVPGSSPV